MVSNKQIKFALGGFTLFVTIVVLALTIATLVKVYEKPKEDNGPSDGIDNRPNLVNVGPPKQITEQAGADKFAAYKSYVQTLKDSLNTTVNPCEDFFQYTCGSYNQPMSFNVVQDGNMVAVAKHAKKDQTTKIGKQASYHFAKCVEASKDPIKIHGNGSTIKKIYDDFVTATHFKFPLFESSWSSPFPTNVEFGRAMGYLFGKFGINTFVSLVIDTNWQHPKEDGYYSYEVYVDQTQLAYDDTYYIKAWDTIKDDYQNKTYNLLKDVAKYVNKTVNETQMAEDVKDIFDMENYIAKSLNTPEKDRRIYERQVHQLTVNQATTTYPILDFNTYLTNAMMYASPEAIKIVTNTDGYKININEQVQLKGLSDYLNKNVTSRTIYNYLFFRLLRANLPFIPTDHKTMADRWAKEDRVLGRRGLERWRKTPRTHPSELEGADDSDIDIDCAGENAGFLWYINARFFVEELLPTKEKRDNLRGAVGLLVAKILKGFQNQLDQLSWMTESTKVGANNKITNLARNIAYPDGIMNNTWLANFYEKLDYGLNIDYLELLDALNVFMTYKSFEVLTIKTGTVRDDFGGPPSIVNAWYQPEMNSITFPLGILQQPFYDINYPASVNFGAMGVVAGHELTHGFDDEGVQWDGVGKLYTWMDDTSQQSFKQMADCVDNQYSQYSPTPNFTVDGRQTLGENLADNGGIRAAYNAYEAHQSFYGSDDRLPDSLLDAFTQEQLFFLSFARVWCEINPSVERLQKQVLVDPHSPSQFRVLGTIQNFPAFQAAFNCPAGATYAPSPDKRCDVWASEVAVVTGIPPVDNPDSYGKVNNVDPPKVNDSQTFQNVASRLKAVVDVSTQPCDDFLTYACGNFNQTAPSAIAQAHASVRSAALSIVNTAQMSKDPKYLTLAKQYLTACKNHDKNKADYIKGMIQTAKSTLNQEFPTFMATPVFKRFDPISFGDFFGTMYAVYHSEIFMSLNVKPIHSHYYLESANALYFDQPRLTFDQQWYAGPNSADFKPILVDYIKNVLNRYSSATGKSASDAVINQDAQDIADYEFNLANNFLQNEYTRVPDYARHPYANLIKASTSVNLTSYFTQVANLTRINDYVFNALKRQDVIIEAMDYFKKINTELSPSNENLRTVYNFIYYRLLDTNQVFLAGDKPEHFKAEPLGKDHSCAEALNWQLTPVYSRAAIDKLYRTREAFKEVQKSVVEIADNVQHGFSTMIDSLSWLPLSTRKQAHSKVDSMVRNIGVPDFIFDDAQLNAYYNEFSYTKADDFVSMVLSLKTFAKNKQLNKLSNGNKIDRTEFYFNLYSDPIWSAYDLNSITFTLDILQPPMYSPDYPSALNFGLLGSLIGHEIGHAFDQNGLTFNQFGQSVNWFNTKNKDYVDMISCVTDQYTEFCRDLTTCNIDPISTLNDNLADNTGLQAALRGFRNWINLKGQDPRLPDSTLDRFSNEQLFFLGYAQQYCPKTDPNWYKFGAKQSPNQYRLLGTLSNSQNFRSSFNCPVGKKYSPAKNCKIWISEDRPVLGLPEVETQKPPLNVAENDISYSTGYHACSKTIESTIDTTIDPCDNFYGYVCNRYQGPGTFRDIASLNQVNLVKKLLEADKPEDINAIKLEKSWFNACADALDNWNKTNEDAYLIKNIVNALETELGVPFPLANNNPASKEVTPERIGQAIGFLSRNYDNVSPLINYFIDSDMVNPEEGYRFYIEITLFGDIDSYQNENYTASNSSITQQFADTLQAYLTATKSSITPEVIQAEAEQLALFEWALAQKLGKGADPGDSSNNPITVGNATTFYNNSISIPSFLSAVSKDITGLAEIVSDPDYIIMIQSPDNFAQFLTNLKGVAANYKINDNTIWNYLYSSIITSKQKYLPAQQDNVGPWDLHAKKKRPTSMAGIKRQDTEIPKHHPSFDDAGISRNQIVCSEAVGSKWTEVNNQLFIEAVFPDVNERHEIRKQISIYAESIGVSFRSMLDQLSWMNRESKKGAYNKLDLFVHNILYPNHTFNSTWLNDYYSELNWDVSNVKFLDLQLIMGRFLQGKDLKQLTITTGADRTLFPDTSQVNAYYQPSANSLTILAGITQPPFYSRDWPNAVNFGAIGLVVGHETTHIKFY